MQLSQKLPLAMQIPLLHSVERHEAPRGIRVPQSGWMHEPRADEPSFAGPHGPLRNTFHRTHRWARIHRHEDELKAGQVQDTEDRVAHVLFSSAADDIGLYGKPMARNGQVWTDKFALLLDGPQATREELSAAAKVVAGGGKFGYRFLYPAMRVGEYEVYWHRPLVAWLGDDGQPQRLADAPLGYLTAYRADRPQLAKPIELWPRLLQRGAHQAAVRALPIPNTISIIGAPRSTSANCSTPGSSWAGSRWNAISPGNCSRSTRLETLDGWLDALPRRLNHETSGRQLVDQIELRLEPGANGAAVSVEHKSGAQAPSRADRASPKNLNR